MTKRFLTILFCLCFILLVFVDINGFVGAGRRGVLLFGRNVMPVLFPFFFISGLLVELDFFSGFGKFGKTAPIFALSLLSGYPTGARLLSELYKRNEISRNEAIKMATFTSTCSPIFIIATLGACFYQSATLGLLIFISHTLGALLNGLLFNNKLFYFKENNSKKPKTIKIVNNTRTPISNTKSSDLDISNAISNSLYSSIQSIFAVGGLIIVFFIVTSQITMVFNLPQYLNLIISAIFEMTNGVFQSSVISTSSLIPCAIVSFGGLCVCLQGYVFMGAFRMPIWFYFLYKTTHTIFAVTICLISTGLF